MADHNDPNAVNHIFSDIDYSPADLYDLFGWPINGGEKVVFALTFASAPAAGVLDPDLLYQQYPRKRAGDGVSSCLADGRWKPTTGPAMGCLKDGRLFTLGSSAGIGDAKNGKQTCRKDGTWI